jgi:4-hydroxy-tetrahydrodipicolinate reductase
MTRIILSGCNGKMGQVITKLVNEEPNAKIVAGIDINDIIKNPYPAFKTINDCDIEADVIIDFSNPGLLDDLLKFALTKGISLVIATTGLSELQEQKIKEHSKVIPIFRSANFSLGINIIVDLVKKVTKALEWDFDIEIIEKHHNQKIDAPSGTALAIADAINDVTKQKKEYIYDRHSRRKKRSKTEIGMHAVRGGTIVGEHQIIFAGKDEVIELKHMAMSKDIFGIGALKASIFMKGKPPGIYSMNNLLEHK